MNLLGIDFEDWYHPELVKPYVEKIQHEPRMHKGLDKIIELLRKTETNATFFVVGKLLEDNPEILDKIIENDHEIAFHTMNHDRIDSENYKEKFNDEIITFSKLTNNRSQGFRAPTFSLNQDSSWIIDSLEKYNYEYDSSIVPAKTNMYGFTNAEKRPYQITSNCLEKNDPNGKILEFPILVTKFLGKKIPAGGGFYLRFLPKKIIKNAIQDYQKIEIPATFYIHSWELTPEHIPKLKLPKKENFITFHNISKSFGRLEELLTELSNLSEHQDLYQLL